VRMFTHVGMLTLGTATQDDVIRVAQGLAGLVGQVPGLQSVDTYVDAGLGVEANATLCFVARFLDEQAWRGYSGHPAHVALIEKEIAPQLISRTFVQAAQPGPARAV
jgi:hypothetical protein